MKIVGEEIREERLTHDRLSFMNISRWTREDIIVYEYPSRTRNRLWLTHDRLSFMKIIWYSCNNRQKSSKSL